MARKGSFEFEIKAVTNSEELDKFSGQLDSFYKKYDNKEMKVKTPDFREAIKSVQSLGKAYEDYQKRSESSSAYTGIADKIKADLDEAQSYFRETKAVLENGDIVSGLNSILDAASKNVHATVVDLGGYVDSLYEKINNFQERLYDLRSVRESVYGDIGDLYIDTRNYGGILNTSELYDQKKILEGMIPLMKEINNFQPGTYSDHYIEDLTTIAENSAEAIVQMQKYNLETTEQLELRRKLIDLAKEESYSDRKVKTIKGAIADDKEVYNQEIETLKNYIEQKERAIDLLKANEQELFSYDGISEYVQNAQQGIERYKSIISDLTDYYDKIWGKGKGGGDTAPIVKSLNELKETISSIKSSLEPISEIFKNEGNAIQRMAENGVSSFSTLSEAVNALYSNLLKVEQAVDSISNKNFNITNITQSSDTIKAVDLTKQYRDASKVLYDQIYNGLLQDVAGQYGNVQKGISGELKKELGTYIRDLMNFDSLFNKKDLNTTSLSKAQDVFERLQKYKQNLLAFINSINNVIPDTFTKQYKDILDPKTVQDSKLNEVAKTIDKSTESVDNSKLATTSEYLQKISEALVSIQGALEPLTKAFSSEDSFFNKMASGDTSFLDSLIEKLNEASKLMNSVAGDSGNANDSSKSIQQEASAMDEVQKKADDAASSKEKFATANKKVKQSVEDTIAGVIAEAAAMEEAGESAQKVWTTPRKGTTLKALNLPTEIVGENGQSITQMFAAVKKQLEDEFHSPVQIEFTSKPNEDGQLEATRATITYINEASGITVKQFYDIARSEEGIVVATQAAEKATIGATKAASGFNAEMQKALALERIETFKKQCGSISIDLTNAINAANAITDKDSLSVFNSELQIAQEKLKQIRSELKGENTLDTIAAAEKKLLTLPTRIDTLRKKLQPLMKLEGADEISKKLDSIMKSYETFMTSNDSDVKIQEFKNIINVLTEVKAEMDNIKQDKSVSAYDDILNKQVASYKKIVELRNKLNSGNLGDEESKSILERLKAEQKNYIELDRQLKAYTNIYNSEEKLKALAEARKSVLEKIAEAEAKAQDREEKKANRQASNYGKSVTNSATKKYKSIMDSYEDISGTFTISDKFQSAIDNYIAKYNQLVELRQKFESNPNLAKDDAEVKKFDTLAFSVEKARKEVKGYIDEASKLQNVKEKGTQIGVEKQFDPSKISSSTAALKEYIQSIAEGKVQITGWNADGTEMYGTIDKGKGIIEQFTAVMDGSINTMYAYRNSAKDTGTAFQQFLNGVRGKAKEIATYLIGGNAVYKAISEIRKGITYVKEIDSALTELKKVTDETDATYAQFLKTMSKTGAEVGATVSDLTNMAANWARLGYSIEEAGELAKSTAVLLNVSEFKSADEASEALISTMQAYGYAAEDSMHVVDVLNEIGNNFAISSDGLATALQDSASSLMAAGNNLEQSVAMVAAANKVLQDPSSVGSALRTISLRIRGTSVKVLEEMGEETDGVIESVSKLQAKVKGLSGVDILTDTGAYKDTYTIIKEIAQVWDQMNDMDQAALLELLAGKNRSNAMAALLGNLEDLEGAYESAMEAQGSAEAENEKYMNSIQGKIDQLNNAVQTMWKNAIDSDVIKFFVDVAKGIVTIVDKFGLLETAIGGLVAYFKYIKPAIASKNIWKKVIGEDGSEYFEKVKIKAKETVDAVGNASQDMAQKVAESQQEAAGKVVEASAQETAAKEASTAATVEHAAANEVDKTSTTEAAAAEQTRAGTSQQEASEQTAATDATLANAEANIKDAETTKAAAEAEAIRAGTSQQEAAAQSGATASAGANVAGEVVEGAASSGIFSKLFSKVGGKAAGGAAAKGLLSGIGKKAASLIPVVGKAILVMGAINLAIKGVNKLIGAISNKIHEAENLKKEVAALEKDFKQSQKESNETLKKLTTPSEDTQYSSLLDEFKQLVKGVEKYGNNIGLTTEQYKRYEEICETICGINPSLASGYDKATKAIGNNASALEQLIELEKVHARESAREYVSDDNLEKIAENAITEYNAISKKYEKLLNNPVVEHFDEIKDTLEEAYNNNTGIDFSTNRAGLTGLESGTYSLDKDQVAALYENFVSYYDDWQTTIDSKKAELESKKKALIDTLLQIPSSMSEYDKLSANSQNFITQWIKNSKMFEIDDDFKAEDVLGMKTSIQTFIRNLANNVYQYTVKATDNIKGLKTGDKIDASMILDQIVDINPSTVDYSQYKQQVQRLIDMLWESLGSSGQALFNNDKNSFAISIGFDFTTKDEDIKKNSELIAQRIGEDAETIQKKVEQMPASQVDAFVKIDWNDAAPNSWQEVMSLIEEQASSIGELSVDSYSTLADNVSKFNEVFTQTAEIVSDNTTVTQEYKDAVVALGASEEELNECFDKQNPLVVKNATLLRKLIATKRADRQATIRMAKAMAQLQYRKTIAQLQQLVAKMRAEYLANGLVSSATLKTASILREQLKAIKQTIKEYSILTLKMSEATNAYKNFEKAKEIDAQLTYGDSMMEALQVISDSFKSGDVGTESFWAAVDIVVPESAYASLDNYQDRLIAIHDYIDKNPLFADWFTIDDNEFKITQENVKNFVKDCQNAGIFTQNDKNGEFFFTDSIKSIDDVVEKLNEASDGAGVTKESIIAMFEALSKQDGTRGDILTDLLYPEEAKINKATTALEKAVIAKENYLKAGGEYNKEGEFIAYNETRWNELCAAESKATTELNKATSAAQANADKWVSLQTIYKSATGEMKLTADQANRLATELGLVDANGNAITFTVDDNGSIQLTADQVDALNKKKKELSEPSLLSVQANYDQISAQIDELQKYIDGKLNSKEAKDIKAKYDIQNQSEAKAMIDNVLNPKKKTIELEYGITKTSEEQQNGTLEKLQDWETNGMKFAVNADTEEAQKKVDDLEKDIEPEVKPTVSDGAVSSAEKKLSPLGKPIETKVKATVEKDSLKTIKKDKEDLAKKTSFKVEADPNTESFNKVKTDKADIEKDTGYDVVVTEDAVSVAQVKSTKAELEKDANVDTLFKVEPVSLQTVQQTKASVTEPAHIPVVFDNLETEEVEGIIQEVIKDEYKKISLYLDEAAKKKVKNEIANIVKDESKKISPYLDSSSVSRCQRTISSLTAPATKTITVVTNNVSTNSSSNNNKNNKNNKSGRYEGTANATGNWGLPHAEHNSLVGEMGQELVVNPHTGHYYTVGDYGAELVDLPKDAIIFNHVQTEQLFKNGHINSRGQAYAEGNAHYGLFDGWTGFDNVFKNGSNEWVDAWDKTMGSLSDAADSLSGSSDDISGAADKFEETFDWFAVLLEEIENNINLMNAQLENSIGLDSKKNVYYQILDTEYFKVKELNDGIKLYTDYSAKLLSKIPAQYREMAKNGSVAITDFVGDANQEVVEAINNYREWASKVADLNQQLEETRNQISETRVAIQDMINTEYSNRIGLITSINDKIQNAMDLLDEQGERSSSTFYAEMIKNGNKQLKRLKEQRVKMQEELDKAVKSGDVKKFSDDWYEMVNAIYDVDASIIECETDLEGFQNSINELHWDNFEKIIDAIDNISDEAEQLRSLIDDDDIADDVGNWTTDGITSLGLLAQQMEKAKYRAELYKEKIELLNKEYEIGKYSTDEYNEKLKDLKDSQWDSIDAYESAKKAIIDVNKTRIEAVKSGIQEEIDAYDKLISKRKEDLNSQKDAHDWAKTLKEHNDEIDKIQKQIDAMSGDNSAAAIAKRKKLEAELAKAQSDLDEALYDRDIEMQQNALDKELEAYKEDKDKRIEELDKYLENEDKVLEDSLQLILSNADSIDSFLKNISEQYGVSIYDTVVDPWNDGANALAKYLEMLKAIKGEQDDLQKDADKNAKNTIDNINKSVSDTTKESYVAPSSAQHNNSSSSRNNNSSIGVGSTVTVKSSATHFAKDGGNGTRMQSWVPGSSFIVKEVSGDMVLITTPNAGSGQYTGWVYKKDLVGYAKGTKGVKSSQLATIDENGLEELVLHADVNGKLAFLSKGTSVIPADLTENLMKLGTIDPTEMLKRNTPSIGAPHITNNNVELNLEFGSLVHVDNCNQDTIPELQKMVRSEFDNMMKQINSGLKRYTR